MRALLCWLQGCVVSSVRPPGGAGRGMLGTLPSLFRSARAYLLRTLDLARTCRMGAGVLERRSPQEDSLARIGTKGFVYLAHEGLGTGEGPDYDIEGVCLGQRGGLLGEADQGGHLQLRPAVSTRSAASSGIRVWQAMTTSKSELRRVSGACLGLLMETEKCCCSRMLLRVNRSMSSVPTRSAVGGAA